MTAADLAILLGYMAGAFGFGLVTGFLWTAIERLINEV